ncbi:MAG: hypothetical protein ACKOXP_11110 [Flavobacteriales bacterium]
MRKTLYFLWIVVGIGQTIQAQVQQKNVRAATFLTFSPSRNVHTHATSYFLHGQLRYYTDQRLSISSDVFLDLSGNSTLSTSKWQEQLLFGANYHWRKQGNDFNVGIQPGLNYCKSENLSKGQNTISPLFSVHVGYRLYISPHFHFFTEGRFVSGTALTNSIQQLSSIRISAGLGFQL